MSATQVFSNKSYTYSVIDNVSAPTFPTINGGDQTSIGYDSVSVILGFGAAASQGAIAVTGGTGSIPDFVNKQTSILNNPATATIGYRNPS